MTSPRHDRDFVDDVVTDLLMHPLEWRHPGLRFAPDADSYERANCVRQAVECGRHLGLLIESGRAGYRVVGFARPAWSRKPGPRRWPPVDPPDDRRHGPQVAP